MRFIGDVHGKFDGYLRALPEEGYSMQVGDLGLGFPRGPQGLPQSVCGRHLFIRGNHDNPDCCRRSPNYAGDWGTLFNDDLFFVSGARSVDADGRIIFLDFW